MITESRIEEEMRTTLNMFVKAAGLDPLRINATSTPPLTSSEFERGVREACNLLRANVLPQTWICETWRPEFPQLEADRTESQLIPTLYGDKL